MRAPIEDVKDILEGETGLVLGTDLFLAEEPEEPDNLIALHDTGGAPPDPVDYRQPTFQVLVRDRDYLSAWSRVNDVLGVLLNEGARVAGNTYHTGFWLDSDVISLGKDETGRFRLSCSLRTHRKEA
jgi:hypothetical protein